MRKTILSAMLLGTVTLTALAQLPEVILGPGLNSGRTQFNQTWDRTLSSDTAYVLTGLYYVDSTYSLTIEPGTVVFGDTAATLIVSRGAQIFAMGAPTNPVVFTSNKAAGARQPGDWGGVILLGRAPLNKVEPLIEGGIIGGTFGGTDPNDNTGVFKYVRIEFAGYRFQLNNEVNGLTLGGVGRGTELHHVQVSYSFDDSYEFFGGTVEPKYLVAFAGTDDEFDTDFGFAGKVQFGFGLRDPNYWDPTGESNGFESDNDGSSTSTDVPYTSVVFSNMTLVGPARVDGLVGSLPPANKFQYSAVLRRSTRESIFNSVIAGYPWGLSIRDQFTIDAANSDTLRIRNLSLAAFTTPSAGMSTVNDTARWAGVTTWFTTPAYNNIGAAPRNPSTVGLTDMTDLNNPNPVPATGSELIGSADFSNSYLASGFDVVTYRGAFDPSKPMAQQWTAGWTNFNPQGTDYDTPVFTGVAELPTDGQPEVYALEQNYPNPFNPSTTIRFSLPLRDRVTLKVFNMLGQEVATLIDADLLAGTYEATFDASRLATGVYIYRLQTNSFTQTMKMLLVK